MLKHKKIIIPIAVFLGLLLWPLAIGMLIAWLIYKYIEHKKFKYAFIAVMLVSTFLINTVWTKTLFSPSSYKNPSPSSSEETKGIQTSVVNSSPTSTPTPTLTLTPTPSPTPTSTPLPTPSPSPAKSIEVKVDVVTPPKPAVAVTAITTTQPVQQIQQSQPVVPQQAPAINTGGSYTCDCSKTCPEISSCAEAQYQLNSCGCRQRDADHDGIACDSSPLNCQQ